MFDHIIIDLFNILGTIKELDSHDIDEEVENIKKDILKDKLKILEKHQEEEERNNIIRKIYDKEMDKLDSKKSMFNNKKQQMLKFLSKILENTNNFINKVDSVSIDDAIEDYIKFLNNGKIGTLESLTRDMVSKQNIKEKTDMQKTVIEMRKTLGGSKTKRHLRSHKLRKTRSKTR